MDKLTAAASPSIKVIEKTYQMGHTQPFHKHQCHQLLVVKSGFIRMQTPTGQYAITPSRGLWIPKATLHQLNILKQTQFLATYIASSLEVTLSNHSQVVTISPLLQALLDETVSLSKRYDIEPFEDLNVDSERQKEYQADKVRAKLMHDLNVLELKRLEQITELALPEPTDEHYREVSEKIRQRLHHQWRLIDVANLLGVSERTVVRQFYLQTGVSFNEWLRRLRLQRSLELLLQNQSIIEVAIQVGYDNPSAFSTAFRQYIGMSPTQYAKKYSFKG